MGGRLYGQRKGEGPYTKGQSIKITSRKEQTLIGMLIDEREWREMEAADAFLQRQVVPLSPIDCERGWPSLTRTDATEGKWGNCRNKSGMCFFLDFLHAAGCRLHVAAALQPSPDALSWAGASACAVRVGTGQKELLPWKQLCNQLPLPPLLPSTLVN